MPNKIYIAPETPFLFRPSSVGGAGTNLEVTSLANGSTYSSAQLDLGAGARPGWYEWRARFHLTNPSDANRKVELYLATSDGTDVDGNISTSGSSITNNARLNMHFMGALSVVDTGSESVVSASGIVFISSRYVQVVVRNATGVALTSTGAHHKVLLTPIPDEIQ